MKNQIYTTHQSHEANNLYMAAILKAMKEFCIEECQGNIHTELRLINKIKAARELFADERHALTSNFL